MAKPTIPTLSVTQRKVVTGRNFAEVASVTLTLGLHQGDQLAVACMQDLSRSRKAFFGISLIGTTIMASEKPYHLHAIIGQQAPHPHDVAMYWRLYQMLTTLKTLDSELLAYLWAAARRSNVSSPISLDPTTYYGIMMAKLPPIGIEMILALYQAKEPLDVEAINKELLHGYMDWDPRLAAIPGVLSRAQQRQKKERERKILDRYAAAIEKFMTEYSILIFASGFTRHAIEQSIIQCVTRGVEGSYGSDLVAAYALYKGIFGGFNADLEKFVDPSGLMEFGFIATVAEWAAVQSKDHRTGPFAHPNKRKPGKFIKLMIRLNKELESMPVTVHLYDAL